jgi:dipeptidyl aminopeptidase/acylaminoacyl peptidase
MVTESKKHPIPPLIPRRTLFGNPDRTMVRISPDGRYLSYLAPVGGVLNVWVGSIDSLDEARPITNDRGRGIRSYGWVHTGRHLIYLQDNDGDENWHVHRVDVTGDGPVDERSVDLTPFDGVRAELAGISPDLPDEILVGLNDRNPQLHDLHRINLQTGERTLVLENDGFMGFVADRAFRPRYGARMNPDGTTDYLKHIANNVTGGDTKADDDNSDGSGQWLPFAHIGPEDNLTTQPRGLNRTGDTLYMVDSRGRDTAALLAVDADTDEGRVLAEHARADAGAVLTHPATGEAQAVSFTYTRSEWTVIDDTVADDLAHLRTVSDGDVSVVDRTLDDRTWIVAYVVDNGPTRYYRYDRGDQPSVTFLFSNRPALDEAPLTRMHPVVITARDGLDMVSYYSLPSWVGGITPERAGGADTPVPDEPLPMVLLVHGGPWARDGWGFDPNHQLLANRGYAVLSVNFRGSTGFGKTFVNAGDREWGARMHDDLLDAVEWAVKAGIADRDRVAIMGGSYGGYATLAGLVFSPEVFACGVDIVGPSNLNTLLDSVPEYWRPMIEMLYTRVGNPTTKEGARLLTERSPLTHAHRIRRPLLIAQGANDPRVKQAESDQIVSALQAKDIPVTYALFPDEGHGFARPENNLAFMAVTEAFLARHLDNERCQPIPASFDGSSLRILAGADGIPGLSLSDGGE